MYQKYDPILKNNVKSLRHNMTKQEHVLWQHLRRKQMHNQKFHRQVPLFGYILDFYSYSIKLGIECDGSQHFSGDIEIKDQLRDINLNEHGVKILRYSNNDINFKLKSVLNDIEYHARKRLVM